MTVIGRFFVICGRRLNYLQTPSGERLCDVLDGGFQQVVAGIDLDALVLESTLSSRARRR
jgi:hypothetical protein